MWPLITSTKRHFQKDFDSEDAIIYHIIHLICKYYVQFIGMESKPGKDGKYAREWV